VYAIGVNAEAVRQPGVRGTGRLTAGEMKQLFDRLDVLVTAAGQTVAEAISCRLPTVIVQTAENQEYNVAGWRDAGCVLDGGRPLENDAVQELTAAVGAILDHDIRRSIEHRASELEVHWSTCSVATRVLSLRIRRIRSFTATSFSLLNRQSLLEVLSWRNDERVSKWMDNRRVISLADHIQFSRKLAFDDGKQFYRIDDEESGIGVVDLTGIDWSQRRAELGLYRNPNLERNHAAQSVGTILMQIVEQIAREMSIETLWLKVRKDNQRAIRLYQRTDYRECGSDATYLHFEKVLC